MAQKCRENKNTDNDIKKWNRSVQEIKIQTNDKAKVKERVKKIRMWTMRKKNGKKVSRNKNKDNDKKKWNKSQENKSVDNDKEE